MHYEDLFKTLCGKYDILLLVNTHSIGNYDDDHPNDTDPKYMATYAEIIDFVGQVEYEEGINYYNHKEGLC